MSHRSSDAACRIDCQTQHVAVGVRRSMLQWKSDAAHCIKSQAQHVALGVVHSMLHQESDATLLGEFDLFKTDLDRLRSKGGEIIRDSPESDEKQTVQKALAEVNRQWLSLQAEAADRTAALSEAADLSHAIEDVSAGVDTWLDQAHLLVQADLQLTDADRLRQQLSDHRQVVKEVPTNQDKLTALGAMVKQLEQTCPAPNSAARVASLKQKLDTVQTKAGVQLSALVDANQRLGEFEREVSELMRWLEQTRARMTMRDTTTDLKSQLDVQERVYRFLLTGHQPQSSVSSVPPVCRPTVRILFSNRDQIGAGLVRLHLTTSAERDVTRAPQHGAAYPMVASLVVNRLPEIASLLEDGVSTVLGWSALLRPAVVYMAWRLVENLTPHSTIAVSELTKPSSKTSLNVLMTRAQDLLTTPAQPNGGQWVWVEPNEGQLEDGLHFTQLSGW
ncbi:hypothetical protein RRG08_026698 [Elysia crispata]|uniref:Uncharacterized protein n=1 Tax=Elysia crispata TaxID=231223 RepID=A0AAE0XVR1_9GAST|nr:hypothetical protein RRG08_026698 [Elysia crispata]